MVKTRKVQVTLEPEQYERLQEVAEREGKSLAAVVRESVVRYCIEPAERRRRLEAVEALERVDAPVPEQYGDWERRYSRAKAEDRREDAPGSKPDG